MQILRTYTYVHVCIVIVKVAATADALEYYIINTPPPPPAVVVVIIVYNFPCEQCTPDSEDNRIMNILKVRP